MKKYKKDDYGKFAAQGERWRLFYFAGIVFAARLVEGLKRCGRDLTRERLVKEMEGITNFRGIGPKISYKPLDLNDPYGSRQGGKETFLVECLEGGKFKKLSDWMEVEYP